MGAERPETDGPRLIAKELQLEVSSKQRTLHFHGESMRPFLVEGDDVVVEPVGWEHLRLGDVVTYRYLDRFPTRRVVRKTGDDLLLWCDNWPDRIFKATRADVLGRAVARRRGEAWLTLSDRAWKRARRLNMLRWRLRQARRLWWPRFLRRARRAPAKLLRLLGLLRPLGEK